MNLLSLPTDLLVLDISYQWNHIKCGPLWLASFAYHDAFKFYSCCSRYQYFIPFYGWVRAHCMDRPHFVYPFFSWWTFGLFPLFGSVNIMYTFFHGHRFSVPFGMYVGVEFLGHTVTLHSVFWGTAGLFSKVAGPFCFHTRDLVFKI